MIIKFLIGNLLYSTIEFIIDNAFRSTVSEPEIGSILYCDLAVGFAEHSGIYVGDNKIVHLDSQGNITLTSPSGFIAGTTALNIYVGCKGPSAKGNDYIAAKAMRSISTRNRRKYNFIINNCHRFTADCISVNSISFLWQLKDICKQQLDIDCWRIWEGAT
jgi:hypothetical protein